MSDNKERMQNCLDLVNKLQLLRIQSVNLANQIELLNQKRRLHSLNLQRIEAQKVLEVEKSHQSNGQPLAHDIHVKRAMVEDMLSQDKPATVIMRKLVLIDKHIQRKSRRYGIIGAELKALESKEKILILQAT